MAVFFNVALLALLVSVTQAFFWSDSCKGKERVATFNTGLTPFIPNFDERRGRVSWAVPERAVKRKIDFMCLQEMW